MSLSEELRRRYQDEWDRSLHHRFVDELWNGTLHDDVLRRYLVQDYQFCDTFVALLGRAVSLAPGLSERLFFAQILGAFASDENTYFTTAFDELNVPEEHRQNPTLGDATSLFLAHMQVVVEGNNYLDVLAVLLVAEWLYAEWAARHEVVQLPSRNIHAEWIRLHNNPTYNSWIIWLRNEFDRAGAHAPTATKKQAENAFFTTLTLEYRFFDQAYVECD